MTETNSTALGNDAPERGRKPRIALMGEFSAGKSTLSNLLLEDRALPEKVTATRLSPVWITYGNKPAYREDIDGTTEPVSMGEIESIPVFETRAIHVAMQSEILQVCDIIDMPGISDPNMSPEVWQRVLPKVDAILWCTHATQAWRQSEAAVWDTIPDEVRQKSLLVVTRFDKLKTENDRKRVLRRIETETKGAFRAVFPMALIEALASREEPEKWKTSGAEAFTNQLIDIIFEIAEKTGFTLKPAPAKVSVRRVRARNAAIIRPA
jgi:GTP-binding protein EngB required for normal cell division